MAGSWCLFCTGHACPAIGKTRCQQGIRVRLRYLSVDLEHGILYVLHVSTQFVRLALVCAGLFFG